jgi:hypothetical protein
MFGRGIVSIEKGLSGKKFLRSSGKTVKVAVSNILRRDS